MTMALAGRYDQLGTYTVITRTGVPVTATRLPLPRTGPVLGFHRRVEGQRLDLIASPYLSDPTAFWRLCDADGAMGPHALAARGLVGVPGAGALGGGAPVAPDLHAAISALDVEENADLPGAFQLTVPVASDRSNDLTWVNDKTFRPLANLAVVVTAESGTPECIFDGHVLSHKLHLDRGTAAS